MQTTPCLNECKNNISWKRERELPRTQWSRITSLNNLRTKSQVIAVVGDLKSSEEKKGRAQSSRIQSEVMHALSSSSPSLYRNLSDINTNTLWANFIEKNHIQIHTIYIHIYRERGVHFLWGPKLRAWNAQREVGKAWREASRTSPCQVFVRPRLLVFRQQSWALRWERNDQPFLRFLVFSCLQPNVQSLWGWLDCENRKKTED